MLELLETVLWPLISALRFLFIKFEIVTGSAGLAIILLALTVSLLMLPLQRMARRVENRASARAEAASVEVQELKKTMKGEELFFATEEVYKKHNYHPIQLMWQSSSLLLALPVLLSALLLFTNSELLSGASFLVIDDLSKPDRLLDPINVLPILMSLITVFDALIRFRHDRSSRYRFYLVATVLFFLVYNLSSGLVLYWATSNLVSLGLTLTRRGAAT